MFSGTPKTKLEQSIKNSTSLQEEAEEVRDTEGQETPLKYLPLVLFYLSYNQMSRAVTPP